MTGINYFERLANYSKNLLNNLPIEKTPQPLEYALGMLYRKVKDIKVNEVETLRTFWDKYSTTGNIDKNKNIGLNTIGMLTDRFTILLIKEWCLRNKSKNPQKADLLFQTQTKEIIFCLTNAIPGNSSINSKITNIKTEAKALDWEEAFYGLLTINLILWESQEVLYIKNIAELPAEELRAYIHWFAHGNMERNALIELCELRFWQKVKNNGK